MAAAFQHVAPPLQADFAGHRLANVLAHMRNLGIEGKQSEQRASLSGRDEQCRRITLEVTQPDLVRAELRRNVRRRGLAHGTAISAAATRRRSPIMML